MASYRTSLWLVCSLLLLTAAAPVHADAPKRAVPDYTGRPETTSTDKTLLWVPRLVLSPLYLVSEYVVRRPLGFLVTEAERANVPQFLYDFFYFGSDHSAALLPIAFLDFGFYPSVGLYFFWKDAPRSHDLLQARASTWGASWLSGSINQRLRIASDVDLTLEVTGMRRPENRFYGIGANSRAADASRYGASRYQLSAQFDVKLAELSQLSIGGGYRRVHFHKGQPFAGDPTLDERIAREQFSAPSGYRDGYGVLFNRVALVLDSRSARSSGVRLEAELEQLTQVTPQFGASFVQYGATAGAFWDVAGSGRVLSLSLAASFVDPLRRGDEVPFTELAALGGDERMRGFPPGRLYGRSSAAATLRYRWPIWVWLDGSVQLAAGNVFDAHLSDFSPRLLRLSGAIGFESVGKPDSSFEILLGAGTETFAQGAQISSLRVIVGTNHGF
jgi:hypothetical protein